MTDRVYSVVDPVYAEIVHEAFAEHEPSISIEDALESAAEGGCACDEGEDPACLRCEALLAYGFTWDRNRKGEVVWTPPEEEG